MTINKEDLFDIAVDSAVGYTPGVGPFLSAVLNKIKSQELAKRYNDWFGLIEYRLSKLEMQADDISKNESFVTAIIQATSSAIKTTKENKKKCLANAVLSSLKSDLDESIMLIYLGLIDKYTELHIKILTFLDNPKKYYKPSSGQINFLCTSISQILFNTYPELKAHEDLLRVVVNDLYSDGLLNSNSIMAVMTTSGALESRTTELGKKFISFISETS